MKNKSAMCKLIWRGDGLSELIPMEGLGFRESFTNACRWTWPARVLKECLRALGGKLGTGFRVWVPVTRIGLQTDPSPSFMEIL